MKRANLRLSWIVLHSLAIALVLVNVLTGLRIAIVQRPGLLSLTELLPQGELHRLHIWGGFGLTAIVAAYLLYRLLLIPSRITHTAGGFAHYHRWVTRAGYLIFSSLLISGWLLLFDGAGFDRYLPEIVSFHFYCAAAAVCYLLLHGGAYFIESGSSLLRRLFHLGKVWPRVNILLLGAGALVVFLLWQLRAESQQVELRIHAIALDQFIHVDGKADEAIWQQITPINVYTHGGANFYDGASTVTLRAVHNGIEAFFHITWEDPNRSLRHLPLLKTQQGWRVQGEGFYRFDEQQFYEDKFALMLANECTDGAAGTMKLGPKPLEGKPANWHGKGYHVAEDGKVRDLWHWKAVRTNDMFLADDNFIGAADNVRPGERRYTAGYMPDSKDSGSYVMNWQWYRPSTIIPKRLPKDPQELLPYQTNDSNPALSWVIPWFGYQPYQAELDSYPLGTLMPSVMYRSNRFEGDRADVRARGHWQDGKWSLELSRKLDTRSESDVPIATGVCLWVAAFDRSQIAHTRHQRPVRLSVEPVHD